MFAGFFSPTNQQFTNLVRDKSESELRKLLFRNFPSSTTNATSKQTQREFVGSTAPTLNKSVFELKT